MKWGETLIQALPGFVAQISARNITDATTAVDSTASPSPPMLTEEKMLGWGEGFAKDYELSLEAEIKQKELPVNHISKAPKPPPSADWIKKSIKALFEKKKIDENPLLKEANLIYSMAKRVPGATPKDIAQCEEDLRNILGRKIKNIILLTVNLSRPPKYPPLKRAGIQQTTCWMVLTLFQLMMRN